MYSVVLNIRGYRAWQVLFLRIWWGQWELTRKTQSTGWKHFIKGEGCCLTKNKLGSRENCCCEAVQKLWWDLECVVLIHRAGWGWCPQAGAPVLALTHLHLFRFLQWVLYPSIYRAAQAACYGLCFQAALWAATPFLSEWATLMNSSHSFSV